jgi:hypothetical protein
VPGENCAEWLRHLEKVPILERGEKGTLGSETGKATAQVLEARPWDKISICFPCDRCHRGLSEHNQMDTWHTELGVAHLMCQEAAVERGLPRSCLGPGVRHAGWAGTDLRGRAGRVCQWRKPKRHIQAITV